MYREGQSSRLYKMFLEGYEGLDQVAQYDPESEWKKNVLLYKNMYYPLILKMGENLNSKAETSPNMRNSNRMDLYQQAENYARAAINYKETSEGYFLLGKVLLNTADTVKAYENLLTSLDIYQAQPRQPHQVKFSIGNTIYYKALVEGNKSIGQALKTLQWGQTFLELEHMNYQSGLDQLGPTIRMKMEKEYLYVVEMIERLESNIISTAPNAYRLAAEEFQKEESAGKLDYPGLIAYASLMESQDLEKSISLYKKAMDQPSSGILPFIKLGNLHLNNSNSQTNRASRLPDREALKMLQAAETSLQEAYPLFQKALTMASDNAEILDALLLISSRLQKEDDYLRYKAMKDQISDF